MTIRPKTDHELTLMQEGGKLLNRTLEAVYPLCIAGKKLKDIDSFVYDFITKNGGKPSFLGFKGYPASSCLSVNDAVVHGIPNEHVLQDGDVVGVDIGVLWQGYHTDAAFTKLIGKGTPEKQKLLAVTQESLKIGIEAAVAGNFVADIGKEIEAYINSQGNYGIIRDLSGHGVGSSLQEPPEIMNYTAKSPYNLVNNMTLAIEPMVSLGDWHVVLDDDEWTVRTKDGSAAAHFETTMIVRENDPIICVPFPLTC